MKNITIQISGEPACGKTTLALAIHDFLIENGFTDVTLVDEDVTLGTSYPHLQGKRMDAIKDRHVTVVSLQQEPL